MDSPNYLALLMEAVQRAAGEKRAVRLLFVCTGNICRSPLAQAVFEHSVHQQNLTGLFEAESAGTHGYHIGDNADPRMRACARRHGVNLDHAARKMQAADLLHYDLLLAMGQEHLDWMQNLDHQSRCRGRYQLYRNFDPGQNHGKDVPDPYYDGQEAFEEVWRIVENCNRQLLNTLVAVMKTQI